ncbi:hypothetical protein [Lishizhenia sp.]|uniref:hypothetical protein n=1 Tax=Lishizhenia sp. TaxID=2497594 RepID=UPI00299CEDA1|nr:hypothetical protein [Lishizhenia sp.]MDX1445547.1 hypothetical protein [Lishizhenia sp.]
MKLFKHALYLSLFALPLLTACNKKGCTNPAASNYAEEAIKEDGSCKYFTKFKITRIEVQEYDTLYFGDYYDDLDLTNADMYFELTDLNNNLIFASQETYFDAPANPVDEFEFDFSKDTTFNNLNVSLNFSFWDFDQITDDFGTQNDDLIHEETIDFQTYTATNAQDKFPGRIEINTDKIEFDVYIQWLE